MTWCSRAFPPISLFANLVCKFFSDGSRIEAGVESDMNSEIIKILPNADKIKEYVNAILDSSVMESDMKIRQILTKSVEVTKVT